MNTTHISAKQAIQYTAQPGEQVICDAGQLWLTDSGDDIILRDGEQHILQGQSFVIESLSTNSDFHTEVICGQPANWRYKLYRFVEKLWHNFSIPHATV